MLSRMDIKKVYMKLFFQKSLILLLLAYGFSGASFYYEHSGNRDVAVENARPKIESPKGECRMSNDELSNGKRKLLQKYNECVNAYSVNSVHVLWFKVWEGESGVDERATCFRELSQEIIRMSDCAEQSLDNGALMSLDEFTGYMLNLGFTEYFFGIILNYDSLKSYEAETKIVDEFDMEDEKYLFKDRDYSELIQDMPVDRESKDVALLYLNYLRYKYGDYGCEQVAFHYECSFDKVENDKKAFLNRYPDSKYSDFVNKVVVDYESERSRIQAGKQHEKDLQEAQSIANDLKERRLWMALNLFGMVGFPQTDGPSSFDNEYDVSTMVTLGLKWQYRRFFLQYQYYMAPGTTFDDSFAENGFFVMLGGSIGTLKSWSIDLFLGVNSVNTHGKYPYLEDSDFEPLVGLQYSKAIQLTDCISLVLSAQAAWTGFYYQELTADDRPSAQEAATQLHLNFGVGVRFWTPKPRSMYNEKYLDLIEE